jgi:hypothetical protein
VNEYLSPDEVEVGRRNLIAELRAALEEPYVALRLDLQTVRDLIAVLEASKPTVVDRDARVQLLKEHRYIADSNLGEPGCRCGLSFPGGFDYIEHAEHVDAVLAALYPKATEGAGS